MQASDGQVIAGIKKDLQNVPSILLNGETYTPVSLVALYQSRLDAGANVASAKAKYAEAVAAYRTISTKVRVTNRAFYRYVLNAYGETSTVLADFGFTAPYTTPLKVEQKAAKAAKAAATRAARGTQGPKKKLQTTGVTAELETLRAAVSSSPAAPSAPAAAPVHVPTIASAPAPQPAAANAGPPAAPAPRA